MSSVPVVLKSNGIDVFQKILGWISFFAWSGSFYPQTLQNYRDKSVGGFSLEFAMLNPVGFYCYSIYNIQGTVDERIGDTGTIYTNDLVFGVHAVILSSIQFSQCFMYDRGKQTKTNIIYILLLVGEFLTVLVILIYEIIYMGIYEI